MASCFAEMRPCLVAYPLCMSLTAKTGLDESNGMAFFILISFGLLVLMPM
jgi:hypothetical protein